VCQHGAAGGRADFRHQAFERLRDDLGFGEFPLLPEHLFRLAIEGAGLPQIAETAEIRIARIVGQIGEAIFLLCKLSLL
jgi:hypothetical protein